MPIQLKKIASSPTTTTIVGGEGPAQLKIIAAQSIEPILDFQLEMGGGQGDGPECYSNSSRNILE